ncbi:MAG: ABC transporter substrate-binding protein [Burkholderiales bacterium]
MNSRRTLLTALGAAAMANALPALAQTAAKVWRVGIMPGGLLAPRKFQWDAFMQRMNELDYVEGKNVQYEIRAPLEEGAPYDELAADLVRAKVDVIVATNVTAIAAAQKATRSIPIVMCPSSDPVSLGFVTSLRQPGGNITGINVQTVDIIGKRLQLLREMLPKVSRVAFVWNTQAGKAQLEAAQQAARKLGVKLQGIEVSTPEALPGALEAAVKGRAEALMFMSSGFMFGLRTQITALVLKQRLPASYGQTTYVEAGGLMSYGPNDTEYYRQAAVFVDKIFKGRKPADLPVEQPLKWELVINMKTAKTLGITVPQVVLLQATRVIE